MSDLIPIRIRLAGQPTTGLALRGRPIFKRPKPTITPRQDKRFCTQCDRMVFPGEAENCGDKFCKGRPA